MKDLENRLDALEIKIAHHERHINDLSDMVSKQWKIIEKLGGQLSKADARIENLENNSAGDTPSLLDEKPPHY